MKEELIASEIKNEILAKNFNRYFDILEKSNQEPFKNNSWRKAQLLYNSIDESNKENLKDFIKMVMIESVAEILAYVDGIATFKEQKYPFELFYNGTKVSGSLQEYLLMDIEDNGFE
jgi:hypothetical protein